MPGIDPNEFRLWARYVHDISGITLEPAKAYLIESRLVPLLKEYACRTLSDLYQKSRSDGTRTLEKRIIDRITTHETFFFRDPALFEMLKHHLLPDILGRKKQNAFSASPVPVRIWCAGCATGQEVYSVAMAAKEIRLDPDMHLSVLGTDISDTAIARARQGTYRRIETDRGLTSGQLERFFTRQGDAWKISDEIRAMTTFKKMNLMRPFAGLGRFDIIFCRNVAIYFTVDDRKKLFRHIAEALTADGGLIIGATETLTDIAPWFEPRRHFGPVFYRMRE